jgi:hypothetical protein
VSSAEGGEARVTCEAADWQAVYTVRVLGGRMAIASVLIEPRAHATDNPPPLSATMARDLLATGPVLRKAREDLPEAAVVIRYVAASGAMPLASDFDQGFVADLVSLDQRTTRGRPRYFYAAIAAKYAELVSAGSSAPVEETALELFGDIRLHRDLVRDALNRARELELLTRPPLPRRPGGELTQLGREALEAGPPEQPVRDITSARERS